MSDSERSNGRRGQVRPPGMEQRPRPPGPEERRGSQIIPRESGEETFLMPPRMDRPRDAEFALPRGLPDLYLLMGGIDNGGATQGHGPTEEENMPAGKAAPAGTPYRTRLATRASGVFTPPR